MKTKIVDFLKKAVILLAVWAKPFIKEKINTVVVPEVVAELKKLGTSDLAINEIRLQIASKLDKLL